MPFTQQQLIEIRGLIEDAVSPWRTKVVENEKRIVELSEKLGVSRAESTTLRQRIDETNVQHDDLENYGRRRNIRMEGIEYDKDETEPQLFEKIKTCLQDVDIRIEKRDVIRFHRSAAPVRRNGKLVAQTIVQFAGWEQRRKAHYANKQARQQNKSFRIHNDLTRRRFELLSHARDRLSTLFADAENNATVPFAYADVNSNLKLRRGSQVWDFNTRDELNAALHELD